MSKAKRATAKPNQAVSKAEKKAELKSKRGSDYQTTRRWPIIVAVGAPLLLFLFIYGMRLNHMIGHPNVDDGYYVLLAKALATGQGYTLINTPTPGIMPIYPPAFVALLSLIFKLSPQFPQNLWLLKLVSIAAMLGVGVVAYFYFARMRELPTYLALGIAAATFLNPGLVHYATSTVMSECVFAGAQLLALVAVERCVRLKTAAAWRFALAGAVFAAFAFLTRSIGVTLIVAATVYLLKERLARAALIFVAAVSLLAGPWVIYARLHAPTPEQKQEQKGYIVEGYATQFWQKSAGVSDSGTITLSKLPERVWNNTADIVGQQVGLIVALRLLQTLGRVGLGILSFILSLLALAGFVSVVRERLTAAEIYALLSLIMILLWPWEPVRFLLPLTPFLIFYILMGARAIHRWRRRGSGAVNWQAGPQTGFMTATVLAWLLLALSVISHLDYIQALDDQRLKGRGELAEFDEVEALLKWARENTPADAVYASLNPPLVYLHTGRKTISAQEPIESWEMWKKLGVRYLVLTSPYGLPESDTEGKKINIVYQSRRNPTLLVVDLGPPDTRAPWPNAPSTASVN